MSSGWKLLSPWRIATGEDAISEIVTEDGIKAMCCSTSSSRKSSSIARGIIPLCSTEAPSSASSIPLWRNDNMRGQER